MSSFTATEQAILHIARANPDYHPVEIADHAGCTVEDVLETLETHEPELLDESGEAGADTGTDEGDEPSGPLAWLAFVVMTPFVLWQLVEELLDAFFGAVLDRLRGLYGRYVGTDGD
jgi:hypothetical protein